MSSASENNLQTDEAIYKILYNQTNLFFKRISLVQILLKMHQYNIIQIQNIKALDMSNKRQGSFQLNFVFTILYLTISTLGKLYSRQHIKIFFLFFFPENII